MEYWKVASHFRGRDALGVLPRLYYIFRVLDVACRYGSGFVGQRVKEDIMERKMKGRKVSK